MSYNKIVIVLKSEILGGDTSMQRDLLENFNIRNIRNVVFWGAPGGFTRELKLLKDFKTVNIYFAKSLEDFENVLNKHLIHLIILDSIHGIDDVKCLMNFFHVNDFSHVPMLMAMEDEWIDQRCEYFTHGISHFYVKGQDDYFIDTLKRMDQDLNFKEGLKNMSIAVLDDDKLQLKIMDDILSRNQIYNVDFYHNPRDLLKVNKDYDVYLIDLILPEVDGEIVMLEMRKRSENAVIIGISSIEKKSTIARVLSIGANDYINKPVNEQVFMAKLHSNIRVLMLLKENELKKKILQDLAIKDGLTGLYNHKHLHELLFMHTKSSLRYHKPLSVIMIDIDNFKYINDTYGHPFGDVVLIRVAKAIENTIRESDILGRYGGEEFLAILPETKVEEAYILGERIREAVKSLTIENNINVSISGGVSQFITTSEQVIYDADQLLYRSKQLGKNKMTCKVFDKNKYEESYLSS
jgi:two-component system cell cycle response regulator